MTDEKICPIMSRPGAFQIESDRWVLCLRERCMAFCPASNWVDGTKRNDDYCKLIERR